MNAEELECAKCKSLFPVTDKYKVYTSNYYNDKAIYMRCCSARCAELYKKENICLLCSYTNDLVLVNGVMVCTSVGWDSITCYQKYVHKCSKCNRSLGDIPYYNRTYLCSKCENNKCFICDEKDGKLFNFDIDNTNVKEEDEKSICKKCAEKIKF